MIQLPEATVKIIARYYPQQVNVAVADLGQEYLPVLRPRKYLLRPLLGLSYSQLPIIQVAIFAMGMGQSADYEWNNARITVEDDDIRLKIAAKSGRKWELLVDKYWNFKCWLEGYGEICPVNQLLIQEYLIKNLFAVGLREEQYIPFSKNVLATLLPTRSELTVTALDKLPNYGSAAD